MFGWGGRPEGKEVFGEVKADAAVALADGIEAGPGDFAGGDEGIEVGGLVTEDASREDLGFQEAGGEWCALQGFDDVEEGVEAAAGGEDALPVGEEACEGLLLDGFDFLAEAGEGAAADGAQDFCVAPFPAEATGAEGAFDDATGLDEALEDGFGSFKRDFKALRGFGRGEGAVGASEAADQVDDGFRRGCEEGRGQAGGQRDAEGVAIAGCVFDRDEALFAGNEDLENTAGLLKSVDGDGDLWRDDAAQEFGAVEVAKAEEEVVDAVHGAGAVVGCEQLELLLGFFDGVEVEQFAEVGVAKQFAELVLVYGECLGAALG